ncbi:DegQ family serine endoprotease [soil metagenome]
MKWMFRSLVVLSLLPAFAIADVTPKKLYDDVSPSLVAVQFQFAGETINRELIGPGIVVGNDGLIMTPIALFNVGLPDEQMKDFKIIIPSQTKDPEELDAVFVGRDERANIAFIRPKEKRDWKPVKFEAVTAELGETVYSVGLLPKSAAYKPYLMHAAISAHLRGEVPQELVDTGLAAAGSPVFNAEGKAIGFVNQGPTILLNMDDAERDMASVSNPPKFFTPASDFLSSLSDPPIAGEPQKLPWMGIPNMRGLDKEVAEAFGLTNQPAVEIGEVLPDSPAAKAGLARGNIIVKINGKPIERPDEPKELPGILARQFRRMKVGDKVTVTVLPAAGQPMKDVVVTLEEMPMRPNRAKRFYAEDLGFVARDMVFNNTYRQHMPADSKGVVVALIKPSGNAETAKLQNGDVITQLNGKTVTDLNEFKADYEAFRKDKPKEAVVLVVWRRYPTTESIRIEPPQ